MIKNKRDSNLELLRVFSMLMIVTYHICIHCVNVQLTDGSSIASFNNGLFSVPYFFKKLLILQTFAPMGQMGNCIFMLIAGYFMGLRGDGIDISKVSKKLLFQLGFATIILTLGSLCVYGLKGSVYGTLIDISMFNQMSWYVGYYFAVIVFAKVYFNRVLSRLNKNQHIAMLWTLFGITQFSWIGGVLNSLASGVIVFATGVFLYALGAYIHKYNPFENVNTVIIIAIIIFVYILIYISFYNRTVSNIQAFNQNGEVTLFTQSIVWFQDNYLVPIVVGVSVFELFRRVSIAKSVVINYLGTATFMVYLLHDNVFFHSIWKTQDWITPLYNSPFRFLLKYAVWVLMTFGAGVAVYSIYLIFEKFVNDSIMGRQRKNITGMK